MHENIYSYNEEINGVDVWIIFKPNFREDVTLCLKDETAPNYESDGEILKVDEGEDSDFNLVYVSEDSQWLLESEKHSSCYFLFVTERTQEINTSLGEEWNKQFNRMLQKAKKDYCKKKKEEIRLYFYDHKKDRLSLCVPNGVYSSAYKYSLDRPLIWFFSIDKRFSKPENDCFILGRIRKTIGVKNSKMMDFIEPVYEIKLDFEKEECDFGEYERGIGSLKSKILTLLQFYIKKEYENCIRKTRITAYINSKSEKDENDAISTFKSEIWNAFEQADVKAIRKLYDVIFTPQDCTGVEFELRLKDEITCLPDKLMHIYFANGETSDETAKWVAEHIEQCIDANVIYLGEIRNRYNFF